MDPRTDEIGRYSVRRTKVPFLLVVLALIFTPAYGEGPRWNVFSSRAGWSINYPGDWKISSCKSCQDPTAPNVFVDFSPADTDSGWVMVEPLADKPSGTTVDAWLAEIKQRGNLNPRLTEQKFTLNNLSALKVRYRNPDGGGHEMEEVYVVSGSRTFAIVFDGNKHGFSLEKFGNYHTYLRMVETFEVKR